MGDGLAGALCGSFVVPFEPGRAALGFVIGLLVAKRPVHVFARLAFVGREPDLLFLEFEGFLQEGCMVALRARVFAARCEGAAGFFAGVEIPEKAVDAAGVGIGRSEKGFVEVAHFDVLDRWI